MGERSTPNPEKDFGIGPEEMKTSGQPRSIEERGSDEEEKTAEQQEGERAAELVEKLYDKLPPHLASHFVEPSVVLSMAGLKGLGEYYLYLPREEQKQREEFQAFQDWTEEVNIILEKEGHPEIRFAVSGKTFDEAKSILKGKVKYL